MLRCVLLTVTALAWAAAAEVFTASIPDLARTRARFDASLYGRCWNAPEVAPLVVLANSSSAMAQMVLGIDPLAVMRLAEGFELSIGSGGKSRFGQPRPALLAQVRGTIAAQLAAALERQGAPAWDAAAGEGWQLGDGILLFGAHVPRLAPQAIAPGEDDLLLRLHPSGVADLMQEEGAPEEALALVRSLLPPTELGLRLTPHGLRQELRLGRVPEGLVAANAAVLARLPVSTIGASAVGIDGAAFWTAHRQAILDQARQALGQASDADVLALADATLAQAGIAVSVEELLTGLRGTVVLAMGGESLLMPSMTLGLPRSPALDRLMESVLTLGGVVRPAEGGFAFLAFPNPLARPGEPTRIALGGAALGRDAGHWWLSSDSLLLEDLLAGQNGGWSAQQRVAAALAQAPRGACMIGASDAQRLLRSLVPLIALGGSYLGEPAQVDAVARFAHLLARDAGMEVFHAAAGADSRFVATWEGALGGTSSLSGGNVAAIAIIAAIAIPSLLESRVTANENCAASTLKSAVFPAQIQFQGGCYNDVDGDNRGEYGFSAQLCGGADCFGQNDGNGMKARDGDGNRNLTLLGEQFDNAELMPSNGYHVQVWIPDGNGGAMDLATARERLADGDTSWANDAEGYFVAYAWPATYGDTGRRVFAITQDGQVLTTAPTPMLLPPPWNAAFGGKVGPAAEVFRDPEWQPLGR